VVVDLIQARGSAERGERQGAAALGRDAPALSPGVIRGEMHDDPSHGFDDATADLDQLQAQRPDLRADLVVPRDAAAQLLVEDVRGRSHQHAQLVGREARAAGAIDLEVVLQLLDPVFGVAALAVELVDPAGRAALEIRHDVARVVLRRCAV
jgi:hypothetical protein